MDDGRLRTTGRIVFLGVQILLTLPLAILNLRLYVPPGSDYASLALAGLLWLAWLRQLFATLHRPRA